MGAKTTPFRVNEEAPILPKANNRNYFPPTLFSNTVSLPKENVKQSYLDPSDKKVLKESLIPLKKKFLLYRLAEPDFKSGILLPFSLEEFHHLKREFYFILEGRNPVGFGSLLKYGPNLIEIRSLFIRPGYRGHGNGSLLLGYLLRRARKLRAKTIFLMAQNPALYENFGFQEVKNHILPQKIWRDCVNCPKIENCDETTLVLRLDEE